MYTHGSKLGTAEKVSFKGIFSVLYYPCGSGPVIVYSNILALVPSEAGASPAGSTPENLSRSDGFFVFSVINNLIPARDQKNYFISFMYASVFSLQVCIVVM